jgi:hypothetical protein
MYHIKVLMIIHNSITILEGNARLDCQQDCQDQCCNSYEQCSFKVKTRSNDI